MCSPLVLIVIGSASDSEVMGETARTLSYFHVPYKLTIASAHRTPAKVHELAANAQKSGIKVVIAGAGYAAHLAGVFAAHTTLPVIAVPLASSALAGVDALLSSAQMPSGVPVATMAIGNAGAKNAAIFAVQILAISDETLAKKLNEFKTELAEKVEKENTELKL